MPNDGNYLLFLVDFDKLQRVMERSSIDNDHSY